MVLTRVLNCNNSNNLLWGCSNYMKTCSRKESHKMKLNHYIETVSNLNHRKNYIPERCYTLRRRENIERLYLIDPGIAKTIVNYATPYINTEDYVCETNAGLGLVASELLISNLQVIRLYECKVDFYPALRLLSKNFPNRIKLFKEDLFKLPRLRHLDKFDNGKRVDQVLRDLPSRGLEDNNVMTIIGTTVSSDFIRYCVKMTAFQAEIAKSGRIQFFLVMRPSDYIILSANPAQNLNTYKQLSVLFNIFFEHSLIDKFPRDAFLPWEKKFTINPWTKFPQKIDIDQMYFVKINSKTDLPFNSQNLIYFYFFVRQFFKHGSEKIIPSMEKWIPGCGLNILLPSLKHNDYFPNLDIFTEFAELTPNQIVSIFREILEHPGFGSSAFAAMVENNLVNTETVQEVIENPIYCEELDESIEEKL